MTNKALSTANFGSLPRTTRRPAGNALQLQWFNSLPAGKYNATGWHIQADRCPEPLTEALKALSYQRLTVQHRLSGKRVEYWSIETCSPIFLCTGIAEDEREGLAYGWIEAKNHSKIKVQCIVEELAAMGW